MNIDEIKSKILKKITEEEYKTEINNILNNSPMMDEITAINILARKLGIDFNDYDDEYSFKIGDIEEGQHNVEIVGRVMDISDIKEFTRKSDNTTGKLRSLIVADDTGSIRITLWNDMVDLADNINIGDVVEVRNARSRKWNNKLELSGTSDTTITKLETYNADNLPEIKDIYKINELKPNTRGKIRGTIINIYDKRTFKRKDGSEGQVKSIIVKDETGTIRGALWDDLADMDLKIGDEVEIEGYVRDGLYGLEMSINNIKLLKEGEKIEDVNIENLLNYEGKLVNVKGTITAISGTRKVNINNSDRKVVDLTIEDSTGNVRISFWGRNIELIKDLKEGDAIKITNCMVRTYTNFEGTKVPALTATGSSKIIEICGEELPSYSENIVKICDIPYLSEDIKNDITVVGKVLNIYDTREFQRDDGSIGKVKNIIISDGTSQIRLSLWDEYADMDIKEGDIIKIVHGYVRENDGNYELSVGRRGRIVVNPKDVEINMGRKFIKELKEGEYAEIRGTVVDYRKSDFILYLCPNCNKRTELLEDKYVCPECGEVSPREVLTCGLIVDDGTDNIYCRIYGKNVEKITNKRIDELKNENISILDNLLGKELILMGNVVKPFDNLEMSVVYVITEIDLDKEIEILKNME